MSSLIIDGREVALADQPFDAYRELTRRMYGQLPRIMEMPRDRRFIGQLPAGYVLSRVKIGEPFDQQMTQVALWNLHDLGVREMNIDGDAGTCNIIKSELTPAAQGNSEAMTHEAVTSGRAFIAALNNIVHRTFKLNDTEVEVGIQPEEQVKAAMDRVMKAREGEEGVLFVAVRIIGAQVARKVPINSPEMRCLIELVSGMGLAAMTADPEKQEVVFKGFSVMSALSTAMLQGVEWSQLQQIREQVLEFGKRMNPPMALPADALLRSASPMKRRRRD